MNKIIQQYIKGMKSDGGGWITGHQAGTMFFVFVVAMIMCWIVYV